MLAPSAATLPQGHFLLEPYIYDVRRSVPRSDGFGSLTYALYGVADRFTVGAIPTAGYNRARGEAGRSGAGMGDLTVQAQYRLTQFRMCHWMPTVSIAAQETLPTARYDRLGKRPGDGFGAGAFTTTFAVYSQMYFWLPNRRILRMRVNLLPSFSSSPKVEGVSVYGTADGFSGYAHPGSSIYVDGSWEYSLTRRWVLALDATYRYAGNTRVSGYETLKADSPPIESNSGSSYAVGLAPAIEYSWKGNLGVLLGVRLMPAGRNTTPTITPALAINFVH